MITCLGRLIAEKPNDSCLPFSGCRPHLNFVSGENGSGKSAALQCLQVCLGLQARLTGRAKTAKELIMTKQSVAVAKVVLWNTVCNALSHMMYGIWLCDLPIFVLLLCPCDTAVKGTA